MNQIPLEDIYRDYLKLDEAERHCERLSRDIVRLEHELNEWAEKRKGAEERVAQYDIVIKWKRTVDLDSLVPAARERFIENWVYSPRPRSSSVATKKTEID